MGRLVGKVAIVTGAAQGIGKGIARAMAAEGAHVVLFDIAENVHTAAAEIRKGLSTSDFEVRALTVDITLSDQIAQALGVILGDLKKVDILVNNAAVLYFASFSRRPMRCATGPLTSMSRGCGTARRLSSR